VVINEQLIARLADAVTQRLASQNTHSSGNTSTLDANNIGVSGLTEVPIDNTPKDSTPVNNNTLLPDGIFPAQQPGLPGKPSAPFEARVSDKVKKKIWDHEFIDFGSLLVNPMGQAKFQLSIQNTESVSPLTST